MFNGWCSVRLEGFASEHVVSRHPLNDPIFYHELVRQIQGIMSSFLVSTNFAFSGVFLVKKAR